jgi:hypothetical protein
LKDVKFELFQADQKLVEQISASGLFQFVIVEGDQSYKVKASKDGFIPKIIHFESVEFPFINEYEIQEIDVEFHKLTSPGDEAEIGELKWSSMGYAFNVVKVDSSMEYVKQNFATSEKKLGEIYANAIENGNELMTLNQPDHAMLFFELALLAKTNDEYSKKKIMEIRELKLKEKQQPTGVEKDIMDQINRGELSEVPDSKIVEGVIYSVQLGAFTKKVTDKDFAGIPDFKAIKYEDYTRVFSGEFGDINLAIQRRKDMIKKGYKDAWIVQMKGNERIGF